MTIMNTYKHITKINLINIIHAYTLVPGHNILLILHFKEILIRNYQEIK